MALLLGVAVLLAAPFGLLSSGLGLVARREESIIGVVQFLLPLTFLSSVFMAEALMPAWMRAVAAYNPVNWSVDAAREVLDAAPEWASVLLPTGYLAAFTFAAAWLALRAFRSYQRSV